MVTSHLHGEIHPAAYRSRGILSYFRLKERSNKKYICYDYDGLFKGSIEDIAHWICYVVNSDSFDFKFVNLKDVQRNSDEGNQTIQEKKPLDERVLINEVKTREIGLISFDGYYRSVPLSVSVDIRSCMLSIALNKNHLVDMEKIETAMRLNRQWTIK